MPLKVAATSVKLAIPPPITSALVFPSGFAVAHCIFGIFTVVYSQSQVSSSLVGFMWMEETTKSILHR